MNVLRRVHWHVNRLAVRHPACLAAIRARLTVEDGFRTPGDTLLTASVCRQLKERHPRLRLNLVTANPDIVAADPNLDEINGPPGRWHVRSWYYDLLLTKDGQTNVLAPTFRALGIRTYTYKARVYLTEDERAWARAALDGLPRPIITVNIMSREAVKVWPLPHWIEALDTLRSLGTLVQLGDATEPELPGLHRWAARTTRRQAMALLGEAALHIGPDSFLMHAANGLDVPAVAIFGGSRSVASLGYPGNANLADTPACSPCWIHTTEGQSCPHAVMCMTAIPPARVVDAARTLLARRLP